MNENDVKIPAAVLNKRKKFMKSENINKSVIF